MDRDKTTARFSVTTVTDEGPMHYAVWNERFMGAVAGRFACKVDADSLCERLNSGATPDYTPRGIQ